MTNRSARVDRFMSELEHPLKPEIERIRSIILASGDHITEHIKWNAPSFCYRGEDRVTFRLHPKGRLQLIFHRGARVKDGDGFNFEDSSGLLTWLGTRRGVVSLRDMAEVEANSEMLKLLVQRWMRSTGPDA
ncbi:MAG TPA: DUF1801 domain-containing protein [Thermomicrobiales bacterium]|nr:DUF1801 domain-containing protein [Thermomicrobiales bacterium]